MSTSFEFHCIYCGKHFGEDLIKLSQHIGKIHDIVRESK